MNLGTESEEVLKQYLKIASSYSIPIFWGTSDLDISANGTAFVLDTGESKFVVTAAHVYRSYLNQKSEGNVSFCQLSSLKFDMEARLISLPKSDEIDIVTFEIAQQEIELIGVNVLRGSNDKWPPSRPNEGDMVVVCGFPGLERLRKAEDYHSFGYYCFNTPVSSIVDRHFRCSFDRTHWIDASGNGLPPTNYNMGGISGAPAIALIKSDAGVVSWRLAGVVYEAIASDIFGEIMYTHHADLIEINGKF